MWTIKIDTPFLIILAIGLLYFGQEAALGITIGLILYGYMRKCFIIEKSKKGIKEIFANYLKQIQDKLVSNLEVTPQNGIKFKKMISNLSDIEAAETYSSFMTLMIKWAAENKVKIK